MDYTDSCPDMEHFNNREGLRDDIIRLDENFRKLKVEQSVDSAYGSCSHSVSLAGSGDYDDRQSVSSFSGSVSEARSDLASIPEHSYCEDSFEIAEAKLNLPIVDDDDDDDVGFSEDRYLDNVLSQQDDDGDTVLHLAIIACDSKMAEYYIVNTKITASTHLLDIRNSLFQTPLHLAVITRQYRLLALLVDSHAAVDIRDSCGNTPLHIACREGDLDSVKVLLKAQTTRHMLDMLNYDGQTCLHLAAHRKPYPIVVLLLQHGADINAQDGKSGRTVLHYAAESGDNMLVNELLRYPQLDVNAVTYSGMTALYLADGRDNVQMKNMLRTNGASLIRLELSSDDSEDDSLITDGFCFSSQPLQ